MARRRLGARPVQAATTETERLVAWLRLPAIALIVAGHGLSHPNPNDTAFFVAIVVFAGWSAAVLAYVYMREVTVAFSLWWCRICFIRSRRSWRGTVLKKRSISASLVTPVNARSVVATSRRANAIRSSS